MTSVREIEFEQIRDWVKGESAKGRPMKEIVTELSSSRDDVTLISVGDSEENRHQKIISSLQKLSANN